MFKDIFLLERKKTIEIAPSPPVQPEPSKPEKKEEEPPKLLEKAQNQQKEEEKNYTYKKKEIVEIFQVLKLNQNIKIHENLENLKAAEDVLYLIDKEGDIRLEITDPKKIPIIVLFIYICYN